MNEDLDDPAGVTAYRITIEVLESLKGKVPTLLDVRNENTSSRYAMAAGEEHLLFLSQDGRQFWVNSCGTSVGRQAAKRLVEALRPLLGTSG